MSYVFGNNTITQHEERILKALQDSRWRAARMREQGALGALEGTIWGAL